MCYIAPASRHGRLAFLRFWSQSAAVRQVLLVRMTTLQEDNWMIIENESDLFMSVAQDDRMVLTVIQNAGSFQYQERYHKPLHFGCPYLCFAQKSCAGSGLHGR